MISPPVAFTLVKVEFGRAPTDQELVGVLTGLPDAETGLTGGPPSSSTPPSATAQRYLVQRLRLRTAKQPDPVQPVVDEARDAAVEGGQAPADEHEQVAVCCGMWFLPELADARG